jgi:hypothetical protein
MNIQVKMMSKPVAPNWFFIISLLLPIVHMVLLFVLHRILPSVVAEGGYMLAFSSLFRYDVINT